MISECEKFLKTHGRIGNIELAAGGFYDYLTGKDAGKIYYSSKYTMCFFPGKHWYNIPSENILPILENIELVNRSIATIVKYKHLEAPGTSAIDNLAEELKHIKSQTTTDRAHQNITSDLEQAMKTHHMLTNKSRAHYYFSNAFYEFLKNSTGGNSRTPALGMNINWDIRKDWVEAHYSGPENPELCYDVFTNRISPLFDEFKKNIEFESF